MDPGAAARPRYQLVGMALATVAFVASLLWTVVAGSPLTRAREATDELRVVGVALVITGACFAVGLALIAAIAGPALGRLARRRGGPRPSLRHVVRELPEVLGEVVDHRWFLVGWYLNSAGTLLPCVVLVVAVLVVLPTGSWGLAVLPAVDLVVSAAVRLQVDRAVRRARAARRRARTLASVDVVR